MIKINIIKKEGPLEIAEIDGKHYIYLLKDGIVYPYLKKDQPKEGWVAGKYNEDGIKSMITPRKLHHLSIVMKEFKNDNHL